MNVNCQLLSLPSKTSTNLNEKYTFKQPYSQLFSIPYPLIRFILKNPTGKTWKKLIQTCKCFYSKNSLYPVELIEKVKGYKWMADGEIFVTDKMGSNIWLYNSLHSNRAYPCVISFLAPKIAKCELQSLSLSGQVMTLNAYQVLTSSGTIKSVEMVNTYVEYTLGDQDVTFDKLLKNLECIETFYMHFSYYSKMFEPDTVKKMIENIKLCKHMRHVKLTGLKHSFDISSFADFIMSNKNVEIELSFNGAASNAYKEIVKDFVNKLAANPPTKKCSIQIQ